MNVTKSNKGFSLVELMVVVAIIGILASVAIPQFSKFQSKARQSEAKTKMGAAFTALKSFQSEWNFFTIDLRNAGFGIEGANQRYNVGYVQAAAGCAAYPAAATGIPQETVANRLASANMPVGSAFVYPAGAVPTAPTGAQTNDICTGVAFTVATWGNPNSGNVQPVYNAATGSGDIWTINQLKVISNPFSGIQ